MRVAAVVITLPGEGQGDAPRVRVVQLGVECRLKLSEPRVFGLQRPELFDESQLADSGLGVNNPGDLSQVGKQVLLTLAYRQAT